MPHMPMPTDLPRYQPQETFTDLLFPGLRIHYGGQVAHRSSQLSN